MNIQHSTFNVQRPAPPGVQRTASLEVGRSLLNVGCSQKSKNGSVLVIVLWVAIGLVSIALYFANSMNYELTASDNRMNGLAADQAIEGAARYVTFILQNFATNGALPDNTQFKCAAVPVGDAKFWLIGRDPNADVDNPTEPYFGLVDEGGKLNLNTANTNALEYLPNMTVDFANAIMDWRGTNGIVSLDYASLGYEDKNAPFETVDELKLVYGATSDLLVGEDVNRNGVLDKNEKDLNGNGQLDPGLFEYTTVYTREPNFFAGGTALTNVNTASSAVMRDLFQAAGISTSYVRALVTTNANTARPYAGMLKFALACKNAGMSSADFANIYDSITTSTNLYLRNRVNVNTASEEVLTALIMGANVNMDQSTAESAAQTLVEYRQQNPQNLTSVAWVVDALGNTSPALTALASGDYVTTHSYQFTADIAAVGAYGRGYRRVKFVFDVSNGSPVILYRQDLSRLGWALGDKVRASLAVNNSQ
jgi:DNA uptake protein ComE-like DNA-binding protein